MMDPEQLPLITEDALRGLLADHAVWLQRPVAGRQLSLIEARLDGVRLEGANLVEAQIGRCHLRNCVFRGCDLSRAWLIDSVFEDCAFEQCILFHANLSGSRLAGCRFAGGEMTSAELYGSDLRGAWLIDLDLQYSKWSGAGLYGAHLQSLRNTGDITAAAIDLSPAGDGSVMGTTTEFFREGATE